MLCYLFNGDVIDKEDFRIFLLFYVNKVLSVCKCVVVFKGVCCEIRIYFMIFYDRMACLKCPLAGI